VTLVSDRFDSKLSRGHRVEIVTPEGVPLVFAVSSVGERVYAFVFDLMVLALVVLGLLHLMLWVMFGASGWLFALMTLLFFLLRNGWFTFFELIWQGRTPGKRRAHLRVIDAQGGALRPIAVVVRNLTRELEIFLPIYALTQPGLVGAAGPEIVQWFAGLWLVGILLLPLFDKRRRRLGDLLAGTMVVRDSRRKLRRDMAETRPGRSARTREYSFGERQLSVYGVYELQVLEQLLRDESYRSETLELVAERIILKIGWQGELAGAGAARRFLEAFYREQRARLEHDLTLGRARERKMEGRLDSLAGR
jgi:uncharacterized RDD family membrane protein YckC